MYNTTSMLRTMELILGLRPMTHFDAGARPMWNAFAPKPDMRPYAAEKPRIPLDDAQSGRHRNRGAVGAPRFQRGRRDRRRRAERHPLARNPANPPPAPVRSYFAR